MSKEIEIYDTTLRDGRQGEGISFSVRDKLRVTDLLDDLGVHFIEGGWPGANPVDVEFFELMAKHRLKNARLAAFGMTARLGVSPAKDPLMTLLVRVKAPVITVFGKSWDLHVRKVLNASLEQNLETIEASCRYLKKHCELLVYDAEHFFDGYKHDSTYALKTLEAAAQGGADRLVLCDTNGGALVTEVGQAVREVKTRFAVPVGIHCHNDSELAVANTLSAVTHGAIQVQGTINGYGERCGNANLCSVVPVLELKMGFRTIGAARMRTLTRIARTIAEFANQPQPDRSAFVGTSAFAHKAGVHVNAMIKDIKTYEHVDPGVLGNDRRYLISDQAGVSNVESQAAKMGIPLPRKSSEARQVVAAVHNLEYKGYRFEGAEASFEMLVKRALGKHKPPFAIEGFRVRVVGDQDGTATSEATVKVSVGGKRSHTVAEGVGPVEALDHALRKALIPFFPQLDRVRLSDFKVRILDSTEGAGAKVRVQIESRDNLKSWRTVGVSDNIIEASWQALIDGLEYFLTQKKGQPNRSAKRAKKSKKK